MSVSLRKESNEDNQSIICYSMLQLVEGLIRFLSRISPRVVEIVCELSL
jgi:hypothetical protein